MSVYFLADPHFAHKNIAKFRPHVTSSEDNDHQIMCELLTTLKKRDILYVLGDAVFEEDHLKLFKLLPCRMILVMGNHDELPMSKYLEVFESVHAILKYKGMWLTHAPIHPDELRGKFNVHGHVHEATVMWRSILGDKPDRRYLNACPEYTLPNYGKHLLSLDEVRAYFWGAK